MIVAGQRISSSTRNKLHSKLKLRSLILTSQSVMALAQSSSPISTESPRPPVHTGSSSGIGDWSGDLFSGASRSRTIAALTLDRDNSSFKFDRFSKKAAVLVPFCYDTEGRPGILYNLRSESLSTHKGEISFPGGTLEPQDNEDPIAGALRETHEELGISKDQVDVWTTCRAFPTVSSNMGVVPVVGFIKSGAVDPTLLQINPDEVDHAFIITLDHLCNTSNWADMQPPGGRGRMGSLELPVFTNMQEVSVGLPGIHLWGLTSFITHLVLSAFIPERYKRKVPYIQLVTKTGSGAKENQLNKKDHSKEQTKPKNSKL